MRSLKEVCDNKDDYSDIKTVTNKKFSMQFTADGLTETCAHYL